MMKRLSNCGGFIFIETLLIAMLLSMAALLVMRGFQSAHKINHDMAVKTAGLHLANAQIAHLRYLAANKKWSERRNWNGDAEDLMFNNFLGDDNSGMTVIFDVKSSFVPNNEESPWHVTVTVTPTVNDIPRTDLEVTAERDIFEDGY